MVLVVEDGTGVTGANTFQSEADATARLAAEPGGASNKWTNGTTAQKEAWLIAAARYICMRYGPKIGGTIYSSTQGLCLPVVNAWDVYGINFSKSVPEPFMRSQALIAQFQADENDLFAASGATAPGIPGRISGALIEETVEADGLRSTERYGDHNGHEYSLEGMACIPEVDMALSRYLDGGKATGGLHLG